MNEHERNTAAPEQEVVPVEQETPEETPPLEENPKKTDKKNNKKTDPDEMGLFGRVLKNGQFPLSRPYKFEGGKEHTALYFPLAQATGADVMAAEETAAALGYIVDGSRPVEFSKRFQAVFAARVAGVAPEYIFGLPARDFTAITLIVQNFLLTQGAG